MSTMNPMNSSDISAWHSAMRAQGQHVWALVDASAGAQQRGRWREFEQINLFSSLTADPAALEIAPFLCAPPAASPEERWMLTLYTQQSAEHAYASLIATPLAADELVLRLRQRIHVDAAGLPMMLRLWDPRALRALSQSLGPDNRLNVLAFGTQALVPDRAGGYETVALSCPAVDPLASDRLALTQDEVNALQDATYPDALLAALREQDAELLDTVPDHHRHGLAQRQWQACEARGITATPDHVLALSLAILHGEDWWAQTQWAAAVDKAQGGSLVQAYRQRMRTA